MQKERKASEAEEEDWYSRWERQKREQYEAFMKKIDQDPFHALFGRSNRWLGWISETSSASPATRGFAHDLNEVNNNAKKDTIEALSTSRTASNSKNYGNPQKTTESHRLAHTLKKDLEIEYEIDPITLKKIPKARDVNVETENRQLGDNAKEYKIPVKKFKVTYSMEDVPELRASPSDDVQEKRNWLVKEGFQRGKETSPASQPVGRFEEENTTGSGSKIESALDRHLRRKSALTRPPSRRLDNEPVENKSEDIDLLRASDVRASAGTRGRKVQDRMDKAARQHSMENQFDERSVQLERQLQQEVAGEPAREISQTAKNEACDLHDEQKASVSSPNPALSDVAISGTSNDTSERLNEYASEKANQIKAKIVPLKTQIDLMKAEYNTLRRRWLEETRRVKAERLRKIHEEEIQTQKAAMEAIEIRRNMDISSAKQTPMIPVGAPYGEGDVAANISDFTSRGRWYKKKAPHANNKLDAKLQQIARDKALVHDIRAIYEDSYGKIHTEHRQPEVVEETKIQGLPEIPHALLKDDPSMAILGVANNSLSDLRSHEGLSIPVQDRSAQFETSREARDLIQEILAELRSIDDLIKDQETQLASYSSASIMIKSLSYKQIMARLLRTASKLIKVSPALRGDLLDTTLSAAGVSWEASLVLLTRALAISNAKPREVLESSLEDPVAHPQIPTTYRILAYDRSTQRLTSAKATSLSPLDDEQPLKPLEALTRLNNPGKFLPQLMSLHNTGYDIVLGAPDILVLKRVRNPHPSASPDDARYDEHPHRPYRANPIDGTTSSTGNYASPTGFVNHDSVLTPEELDQLVSEQRKQFAETETTSNDKTSAKSTTADASSHLGEKVRREEPVFSGSSRGSWQNGRRFHPKKFRHAGRRHRVFRRTVSIALWTLAVCYTLGTAFDVFLTRSL